MLEADDTDIKIRIDFILIPAKRSVWLNRVATTRAKRPLNESITQLLETESSCFR
jgi:hypothetical protein